MSKCIECLEKDLRNRTDRCMTLEQDVITMSYRNNKLASECTKWHNELKAKELENKQLKDERDNAKGCCDSLQELCDNLIRERDSARCYNKTLINVNHDLREEVKQLKLKNMELASNQPLIMQCCHYPCTKCKEIK
jgi:uncharacterized protein (DUF3084 family)